MSSRHKLNFLVDFTNTMVSWNAESSPYDTGVPQASPSRPGQDPLRRDYGGLWSPPFGTWQYGLPQDPGRETSLGDRAPNSLIESYAHRTYQDFIFVGRDLINNYSAEQSTPVSPLDTLRSRPRVVLESAGAEHFYGNEAPYGYIRQRIRIEANRDLLPAGGVIRTYAAGDADTGIRLGNYPDPADVEAWNRWCQENYYGRETEGSQQGYYKTFLDHCTTYNSPFTPAEERQNPNSRTAARTNLEYNYYIKNYENTLAAAPLDSERIAPHIYTMYFEKSRGMGVEGAQDVPAGAPTVISSDYNSDYLYSDFVTLNRSLSKVFMNTMRLEQYDSFTGGPTTGGGGYRRPRPRLEKTGEGDDGEYFERWTSQYNRIYNPVAGSGYPTPDRIQGVNTINSKYKNLLFTRAAAEESQVYNLYKTLFPMYGQIEFPIAYSQFMGSLAGTGGDVAAFRGANTSTIARVWDAFHGAQQRQVLSEYLLNVNFAENHQSGDNYAATQENITNGTQRTVFRLADMFENLDSSRGAAGANIRFVEDFVSFRTAMGVTTALNPADDRGRIIDTNIEEIEDESIVDLNSSMSYNEFVDNMINHLQLLSTNFLRSYTEMLEGAPSFSCPLYYRINKYQRVNGQRGDIIQTVVVPQYTTIKDKIFEYVDSQLRYENDYEYEITLYNVVIGSKYRFTELYLPTYTDDGAIIDEQVQYFGPPILAQQSPNDRSRLSMERPDGSRVSVATAEPDTFEAIGNFAPVVATDVVGGVTEPALLAGTGNPFFAEVEVVVEPSIVVMEVPYIASGYSWMPSSDTSFGIVTMLDDPGVSPNVQVIPYRGVNDRILFNLTTGNGRERNIPITLNPEEESYIARLRQRNGGATGREIVYENEEPSKAFEIYRLTSLPSSYADFYNNQIAYIPTDDKLIGYRVGNSVSYVDNILPNSRYYYMFRSIDIHGHYSYPSEIYEVELIDDSGAVYPRVRVVDPTVMQNRKTPQKKLKRFLQIKPQLSQRLFNLTETFAPLDQDENASAPVADTIVLGYEDEKIWDRKFKVRLTSKKSGKKIDLNIIFKKEYSDQRNDF